MSLRDYLKGHASTSKAPGGDKAWTGQNPGPFLGIVKGNKDPARMGRLSVFIPTLAKTSDPVENQLITCEYLAPFYGAKGERFIRGVGTGYNDSQHSYGMWMVPPDLETKVLVIFAEGKMEQAYWIGCVQDPFTNHMTPGIASSENTNDALDGSFEGADAGFQEDKKSKYGTTNVPSGELNRARQGALQGTNYDSIPKPIHPLADVLLSQGLIADDVRGNTSSSARRESPSQVFGISTPGPKDKATTKVDVGARNSGQKDFVSRKIGHTFVMDDGDVDGNNQLTRLRTASGHQLLMHDTEGVVYLANGSGKAFIEMERDGTISVYSDGGINMRTSRDFNLHSDMNINMHAKGQINFTSETNVALNAEGYLFAMGEKGILNSSQGGAVRNYARDGISSYTDGTQLHGAGGRIDLAGSQVHFNSVGASSQWGPGWLKPDAVGIRITGENPTPLNTDGTGIDIASERPFRPYNPKVDDKTIGVDKFDNPIVQKKSGAQPNRIKNKTTVSQFVTHEPYERKGSDKRIKDFINEAVSEIKKASVVNDTIERIKKANPGISSTELERIKEELMDQPSIKAVADQLGKLPIKINLPTVNLNDLGISSTELKVIKAELLKQPSIKAVADKLGTVVKLNDKIKLPVKNLNTLVAKADQINKLINLDPKSAALNFVYGKIADLKSAAIDNVKSFFNL